MKRMLYRRLPQIVCCLLLTAQAFCQISAIRGLPIGSVVTVKGVVLNGSEQGEIRFIQDATAAIAAYPGGSSPATFQQVMMGDEISVTGVLSLYRGLLEVNPIFAWERHASEVPLPAAEAIDPAELTFDDQGKLVFVSCVRFARSSGAFEDGENDGYTNAGLPIEVYVETGHPLSGMSLPTGSQSMTAIASFEDGWRFLLPVDGGLTMSSCPTILPTPEQKAITSEGFTVHWSSDATGVGLLGVTDEQGIEIWHAGDEGEVFEMRLEGLSSARFYWISACMLEIAGDTICYPPILMSTKSTSSGDIRVYFNKDVDGSYSDGSHPDGTSFQEMLQSVMDVIENAVNTLDIAMYNSNRPDIIFALELAEQRGVRVRMIADADQSNSALDPLPNFPVYFRSGDGIMHNKFIIADAEDPIRAIVWTGSTNHSSNQLGQDPNNTLVIQDEALARAYVREFEEMWGGDGNMPVVSQSKTGSAKKDNTPHLFIIGETPVELYFSPSDRVNRRINGALQSAGNSIDAALLIFTRIDLAQTIASKAEEGVRARVVVDDAGSSAVPLAILGNTGVRTAEHAYGSIFHHKYVVIDEGTDSAFVLTGSHNWTTSATTVNDENTIILHDRSLANIYLQEFEARWSEVVVSTMESPVSAQLTVYPNPCHDLITIESGRFPVELWIHDLSGRLLVHQTPISSSYHLPALDGGLYLLSLADAAGHKEIIRLIKQ